MTVTRVLSLEVKEREGAETGVGAIFVDGFGVAFVLSIWTLQWKRRIFFGMSKEQNTDAQKSEVLQGTLDLMVLKVLDALGPQHGYGIARRIEQVSKQVLQLNEGTVYTSLLRLQQRKWIASEWGTSENNRKAKYYSITKSGRKQLALETENWERIAGVIGRLLRLEGQE
jgi:PadR family transcriptional regulator, regulatory protein PadR